MKIDKIQSNIGVLAAKPTSMHLNNVHSAASLSNGVAANKISFTGRGTYILRNLSREMKNVTEYTNALIAAIGTGIIAPLVILGSPGKGDKNDKDKKKLQALRQPISAIFQLGFQVPATMAVNKGINYLVYKKHVPMFNDEILGNLIPDNKYLKSQITDAEYTEMLNRYNEEPGLRQELENLIKDEYAEAGVDNISDSELAKKVQKRKKGFLKDKIVEKKHNDLLEEKIAEMRNKLINEDTLKINGKEVKITEERLLTSDYRDLLAKDRYKADFARIREEANLSWFDKVIETLGFSNKKLKTMDGKIKALAKEKGLELLKEDNPTLLTDSEAKLRRFVRNCEESSRELYGKKKFWISLGVNLFMIAASCYALNWAHPRVNEFIMRRKAEKEQNAQGVSYTQKAEVK